MYYCLPNRLSGSTGWQLKNGHQEMWLQAKIGALNQNPIITTIVPYIPRYSCVHLKMNIPHTVKKNLLFTKLE